METQCLTLDEISNLPQNIIEDILSLMPIKDALRTSILSKRWKYCWRSMPKLVFEDNLVEVPIKDGWLELKKYKLASAVFHVLLLHNCPAIVEFNCSFDLFDMYSEFSQILSYLAKGNKVKELTFVNDNSCYKLPDSFFSSQGLEHIHLENCMFELPVTFKGFTRLKSIHFLNVNVSVQMLQKFLSKCPLLEHIYLNQDTKDIDFVAGVPFVEVLQCVPLIKSLDITVYYMQYLCGGMPPRLPTPLVHLRYLDLELCMADENEVSFLLCIIWSSPSLENINLTMMYDEEEDFVHKQTSTNFFDRKDCLDLNLDHLETLEIVATDNLSLEIAFVKLIMAKSPVLRRVLIEIDDDVSLDEEAKMHRELLLLPFPRASPSAKLIIKRSEPCL